MLTPPWGLARGSRRLKHLTPCLCLHTVRGKVTGRMRGEWRWRLQGRAAISRQRPEPISACLLQLVAEPHADAGETGVVVAQVPVRHVRDRAVDGPALVEGIAHRRGLAEVCGAAVGIGVAVARGPV